MNIHKHVILNSLFKTFHQFYNLNCTNYDHQDILLTYAEMQCCLNYFN